MSLSTLIEGIRNSSSIVSVPCAMLFPSQKILKSIFGNAYRPDQRHLWNIERIEALNIVLAGYRNCFLSLENFEIIRHTIGITISRLCESSLGQSLVALRDLDARVRGLHASPGHADVIG